MTAHLSIINAKQVLERQQRYQAKVERMAEEH